MASLRLYAPSFMTVLLRPKPIEFLGLLLALLGLTTRIEHGFWPAEFREYLDKFWDAICFETSSKSISTVVYAGAGACQLGVVFIMNVDDVELREKKEEKEGY